MKRRRFCWIWLLVLAGGLLAPVLLWVFVVLIAPTRWARSHVVAVLERSSGRSVKLDALNVCFGGGVSLSNLRIGAPRSVGDPWLEAPRVQIDVSPFQLLRGKFEPTSLDIDGLALRVLRRQDGSLELADLVRADPRAAATESSEPHQCGLSKLRARLHHARIQLIDIPTQTSIQLQDVEGEGVWEDEGVFLVTLSGQFNEGPFEFTAHYYRSGREPIFEGQFRVTDAVLDPNKNVLRYLVPVLAGPSSEVQGKLDMNLYLSGQGNTRETLCQTLRGRGSVSIDPIVFAGVPMLTEIADIVQVPPQERTGSIQSNFTIENSRITTDRLSLHAGRVPIVLSGWTGFDGTMSYRMTIDNLVEKVPEKARDFLAGLDIDLSTLTSVSLRGTVDKLDISLQRSPAARRPAAESLLTKEERDRLRVLGKRLRDKVLR
jgi:AsmA protein